MGSYRDPEGATVDVIVLVGRRSPYESGPVIPVAGANLERSRVAVASRGASKGQLWRIGSRKEVDRRRAAR